MKIYKMAITTQNSRTQRITQEVVEIIAEDYHSAIDKFKQFTSSEELIIDVYVF